MCPHIKTAYFITYFITVWTDGGLLSWFKCSNSRSLLFSDSPVLIRSLVYFFFLKRKKKKQFFSLLQIRSDTQSCPTLYHPMNCSTPGLPVHHQLPEFTQTHVHKVSDTIQPSHPLSSPSPPAPNPSQHQSLFQWVNSSHEVAKVLEFQL